MNAGFDSVFTVRSYNNFNKLLYSGGPGKVFFPVEDTVVVYVRAADSHDLSAEEIASIQVSTNSEYRFVEKAKDIEKFPVPTFSGSMQESDSSVADVYAGDASFIRSAIALPDSYSSTGNPTPVIMLCHGYTGYITDTASNQNWYPYGADTFAIAREKFLGAGYAIFDVSNTAGATGDGVFDIGNPMLVQAYKSAWDFIRKHYNVEDRLRVWAMSFGSFAGVNFVMQHPSDCKSLFIAGPRVSYKSMWDDQPGCHSLVAKRFGFKDASQYNEEIMAQYDLYDMYEKGVPVSFPVPVKWLAGGAEYPSSSVYVGGCGNLAKHLAKYCNVSTFRVVEGMSHVDVCHLNNAGLCDEVLKWFNRF